MFQLTQWDIGILGLEANKGQGSLICSHVHKKMCFVKNVHLHAAKEGKRFSPERWHQTLPLEVLEQHKPATTANS